MAAAISTGAILAVLLPVLAVPQALAITAAWVALLALLFVVTRPGQMHFDPGNRRIIIQWRTLLLADRRKEIPLDRFGSVLSYYPLGYHSNWVYLVEHTGDRGLLVATFGSKWKPRSFWDLFPALVEADGARELRQKLSHTLQLRDAGFVRSRWPLKASK